MSYPDPLNKEAILIKAGHWQQWDRESSRLNWIGSGTHSLRGLLETDSAKVVYVNTQSGDDINGDGSSGNPYKTITRAEQDIDGVSKTTVEWMTSDPITEHVRKPLQVSLGEEAIIDGMNDYYAIEWPDTGVVYPRVVKKGENGVIWARMPGQKIFYSNPDMRPDGSGNYWNAFPDSPYNDNYRPTILVSDANFTPRPSHVFDFYWDVFSTTTGLYVSYRPSDGSGTWTTVLIKAVTLTSANQGTSNRVEAIISGNRIIVIARSIVEPNGFIAYSDDGGATWTMASTQPSLSGNAPSYHCLTANNGTIQLTNLISAYSTDNGDTWVTENFLNHPLNGANFIANVYYKDYWYIALLDKNNHVCIYRTQDRISYERVFYDSGTWQISPGTDVGDFPWSFAFDGDRIVLQCLYLSQQSTGIWYLFIVSIDGGNTWTAHQPIGINYEPNTPSGLIHTGARFIAHWQDGYVNEYFYTFGRELAAKITGCKILYADINRQSFIPKNCTIEQPVTLEHSQPIENNRFEKLLTIQSNIITLQDNLLLAGLKLIGDAAALDDIQVLNCTIIGDVTHENTTTTDNESIKDCIIEGDVIANVPSMQILSGNMRGNAINATVASAVSALNPLFKDTVNYELRRKADGFPTDSPLIGQSLYSTYEVNGSIYPRDLGAWSFDNTTVKDDYSRAFYFMRPAKDALKVTVRNAAKLLVSLDGTPDVPNFPERRVEVLQISYGAIDLTHQEFLDYMEKQLSLQVELYLDPKFQDLTTVTLSAAASIGDFVIQINPADIPIGTIIQIGADNYSVTNRYPASGNATKLVLHQALKQSASGSYPIMGITGAGIYHFIPQESRELTQIIGYDATYKKGAILTFVRKKL